MRPEHRDERKTHETSSYRCVRWWKMNVPTGYVRQGRRVVNPKAVYGSQRGHARALYRRINGRPGGTLTVGADDRIREPVNWGLVVALLGCLALWGTVVVGLVVAV